VKRDGTELKKKEQRNSKEYKNNEKVLNKQLFRKKRNMDKEEREGE
jgi:hypothetical protein